MKKWIKRISIAVLVLLFVAGGLAFWAWHLKGERPDWYPAVLDPVAAKAAAQSVENKFAQLRNWAGESNSSERAKNSGRAPVATDPASAPARTQTITLTEPELNAFFAKWDKWLHWGDRYGKFITDPVLALRDDRIIMAGTMTDANMLLSIHLTPQIDDDGNLDLQVQRVMGGMLPLPRSLWDHYSDKLTSALQDKVDQLRSKAAMNADGSMNKYAVATAMDELLLNAIEGKPSAPVLFLPHDLVHPENGYPVKLTKVSVKDKTLSLTVVALDAAQRQQLLQQIRNGDRLAVNTKAHSPAVAVQ